MGIKETALDVLTKLAAITVTNGDGIDVNLYAAMFNNQIEREQDGSGYSFQKPATFLEIQLSDGVPLGGNATGYDCIFRLLVAHQMMNEDGILDQNLNVVDLVDKIHRALNGVKIANCSPLYRNGITFDTNHGNIYLKVLEYKTYFVDRTSADDDVLNESVILSELTNPTLGLEFDILKAPTEDEPTYNDPILLDIISQITPSAGLTQVYLTVKTDYTALSADNTVYIIFVNAQATITLPTAIDNTAMYIVKKLTADPVTVVFSNGQNADGSTSITLTKQYEALEFRPNPNTNNFNIF